jgi:hypothetical protein
LEKSNSTVYHFDIRRGPKVKAACCGILLSIGCTLHSSINMSVFAAKVIRSKSSILLFYTGGPLLSGILRSGAMVGSLVSEACVARHRGSSPRLDTIFLTNRLDAAARNCRDSRGRPLWVTHAGENRCSSKREFHSLHFLQANGRIHDRLHFT